MKEVSEVPLVEYMSLASSAADLMGMGGGTQFNKRTGDRAGPLIISVSRYLHVLTRWWPLF